VSGFIEDLETDLNEIEGSHTCRKKACCRLETLSTIVTTKKQGGTLCNAKWERAWVPMGFASGGGGGTAGRKGADLYRAGRSSDARD